MAGSAARTVDALERVLAALGEGRPAERAALLNELSIAVLQSDPQRALELARDAGRLAGLADDRRLAAESLRMQAAAHHRLGRLDQALAGARQALQQFEQESDQAGVARCASLLGNVEVRLGQYPAALRDIHQALTLYQASGNREGMAGCHNNLGNIHKLTGSYPQALEHFNQSVALKRELDDQRGIANTLINSGGVLELLGKTAAAREDYEQSLAIFQRFGEPRGQAYCLNNIATLSHNAGDYAAAAECYRRSLDLGRQVNDWEVIMAARLNLAHVTFKTGDAAAAEADLTDGLAEATAHDDPHHQITALQWLAEVCAEQGRVAEAQRHVGRALQLAAALDSQEQAMSLHQTMAGIAERAGDAALALAHYKQYHHHERELFNKESEARVEGIRVAAEVEQVRREKDLLQTANAKLTSANQELEQLNRLIHKGEEFRSKLMEQVAVQSQELDRLSKLDGLTGLYNRRYLDDALEREFARARRYRTPLTVAMVDIDLFKQVNDAISHHAGDEVLKAVAGVLKASCRTVDLAARYGGEEFVLVFPETGVEAARTVCERIRGAVAALRWAGISDGLRVTISIGLCDDLSLPNHEKLLSAADARMYQAKQQGRDRVVSS